MHYVLELSWIPEAMWSDEINTLGKNELHNSMLCSAGTAALGSMFFCTGFCFKIPPWASWIFVYIILYRVSQSGGS